MRQARYFELRSIEGSVRSAYPQCFNNANSNVTFDALVFMLQEILIDELWADRLLELSLDCRIVLICIDELVGEISEAFDELGSCDGFVRARHEWHGHLEQRS